MTRSFKGLLVSLLLLAGLSSSSAFAAKPFQEQLTASWRGSWVVTSTETRSACSGFYTNNLISGRLAKSDGAHRFDLGEVGQVQKVDVKRARVDLLIDLDEPLLIAYEEGPFQLFRDAHCKIELRIEVPRAAIKSRDLEVVGEYLAAAVERFETSIAARESGPWNGRLMEPYPENYEETLAAHEAWRVEEEFRAVRERLVRALDVAERITSRVSTSVSYSQGLTAGMRGYSQSYASTCWDWAKKTFYPKSGSPPADSDIDAYDWERGYKDGQELAFQVELAQRLGECL